MAWALVGTIGTATQGAAGATVSPSWGTSENRTNGNLLVAFVACTQVQTFPATPTDWYVISQVQTGTTSSVSIFGKAATGSDAAPTFAAPTGSAIVSAQLAEYSGVISGQPDKTGSQTGTASPITATFNAASTATSELILIAAAARYSNNRAPNLTLTSNHITSVTQAGNNNGTSTVSHYSFGYGSGNSISGADTAVVTLSVTTNLTTDVIVGASFKLGVGTPSKSFTANAIIKVTQAGVSGPAPSYIDSVTGNSSNAGTTSATVTLPSYAAGDLLMIASCDQGGNQSASISGFTRAFNATAVANTWVFTKIATGSEGASVTLAQTVNTAVYWIAMSFRGASSAIDVASVTVPNITSADPPSLTVDPVDNDNRWVALVGANASAGVTGYPTGFTDFQKSGFLAGGSIEIAAASTSNSNTTQDPGAFTFGVNATGTAVTIAIRPAGFSADAVIKKTISGTFTADAIILRNSDDVQQSTFSSSGAVFGASASNAAIAQSFVPAINSNVYYVSYAIARNGTPGDVMGVTIQSDTSNAPSGTTLATVSTGDGGFSTSLDIVNAFVRYPSLKVSASSRYWLVWQRTGSVDATNNYSISNPGDTYASGRYSVLANGMWSTVPSSDLYFVVKSALYCTADAVIKKTQTPFLNPTSPAGSWTVVDLSNSNSNNGVATDGTTFVVAGRTGVGNFTDTIWYTNDPSGSWTQVTLGTSGAGNGLSAVTYGNGYWVVAGGGNGGWYATSPSGTWTQNTSIGTSGILAVAYGNGYWVVAGLNGVLRYRATDPTGSFTVNTQGTNTWQRATYANGYWVIVNSNSTGLSYRATDPTGAFTSGSAQPDGSWGLAYGNGYWVVTGTTTPIRYRATDPTGAFTNSSTPWNVKDVDEVTYTGTYWVAGGNSGRMLYIASDPTGTWTDTTVGSVNWRDVASNSAYIVLAGDAGRVAYTGQQPILADAVFVASSAGTHSGSFTANAVIKKTISATFTADAVIKRNQTGSGTADAIVKRNQTGLGTADAVIKANIAATKTADAVVFKAGITATFTANAITKRTISGSGAADAIVKAAISGSGTADAVIKAAITGSLTENAITKAAISNTYTENAIVRRAQTASATADAVVKRTQTGSFTENAVSLKTQIGSFTANAAIAVEVWNDSFNDVIAPVDLSTVTNGQAFGNYYLEAFDTGFIEETGSSLRLTPDGTGAAVSFWGYPTLANGGETQFDFKTPSAIDGLNFDTWIVALSQRVGTIYGDGVYVAVWDDAPIPQVQIEFWESSGAPSGQILNITPSTWYRVKFHTSNVPGTPIYAKAWKVGDAEPAWQVSRMQAQTGQDLEQTPTRLVGPRNWNGSGYERLPIEIGNFILRTSAGLQWYRGTVADAAINATQSGSFTADASIGRTQSGSATASAVIKATATAAPTADAVLFKTISGAPKADAAIIIHTDRTANADAVIKVAQSGSLTANSFVQGTNTYAFSLDAVLKKAQSASSTADAAVLRATSSLAVTDAIVRRTANAGLSTDAIVKASASATRTADAVVQRTATGSFAADAVIRGTASAAFTANADLKRTISATFTGDGTILRVQAGTFLAGAVLAKSSTATYTADAWLLHVQSHTATADAVIYRQQSGNLRQDAVISRAISLSFTADAITLSKLTFSKTADAVTEATSTAVRNADAVIGRTASTGATADAYIFLPTFGSSFSADSIIRATQSTSFSSNAWLFGSGVSGFAADAVLFRSSALTFGADAITRVSRATSLTADAVIIRTQAGSFSTNAIKRAISLASVTGDAILLASRSQGATADAYVLTGRTGVLSANAVIRAQRSGSFNADAAVRTSSSNSITADGRIRRVVQTAFTVGAVLLAPRQNTVTLNAVERRTASATFVADARFTRLVTGSFEASAVFHRVATQLLQIDAITERQTTQSFSAQTLIAIPITGSLSADAWLTVHVDGEWVADAVIQGVNQHNFNADATFDVAERPIIYATTVVPQMVAITTIRQLTAVTVIPQMGAVTTILPLADDTSFEEINQSD